MYSSAYLFIYLLIFRVVSCLDIMFIYVANANNSSEHMKIAETDIKKEFRVKKKMCWNLVSYIMHLSSFLLP